MRMDRAVPALLLLACAGCGFEADGQAAAQSAAEAARVEVRRVWSGNDHNFYDAAPSPDGRLMSEIDWSTGDLAVVDLETGERRRITHKGTWTDNVDYAEFSVFSPDGRRLAYTWFREASGYQLRVIDTDGTNERVLVPHSEDLQYIAAEDWSPDGQQILVTVLRRDRSSQIATVSPESGAMRVLKTSDWRPPFVSAFSRDSRWIAFDFQPDEDRRQRDIFVMRADGSRESRVVAGPSEDVLLGWLPDGSGILFYSDRHQTRAIWKQAIRDGRADGEPQLVKADVWQLFPLGFSTDAYYYGVDVELPQVHTATIDAAATRVVVAPTAVQDASSGLSRFGAWSADGRYFAYLRLPHDRSEWLVIRSVDGADTREIRLDLVDPAHLQWDPDGRSVLVGATDPKGRTGIHRVNLRTGESEILLLFSGQHGDMRRYRLSPDGRYILYWKPTIAGQRGLHKEASVIRHDLATGEERPLHANGRPGPSFFSPDGERYVKMDGDPESGLYSLRIARTDGTGDARAFYETQGQLLQNRGGFPFTPDGRYVLAAELRQAAGDPMAGRTSVVRMIPVDGGAPIDLFEWPGQLLDLRLSPDGRRLSFGAGRPLGEIWVMENLGPVTPTADPGR